jgi:translation elongation factor EF-G
MASLLTAQPRLMEPVFSVEVQTEENCVNAIQQVLRRKRGQILSVEPRVGTPIVVVKSHMPVSEAFKLTDQLRAAAAGRAFPQCVRTFCVCSWRDLAADLFVHRCSRTGPKSPATRWRRVAWRTAW